MICIYDVAGNHWGHKPTRKTLKTLQDTASHCSTL